MIWLSKERSFCIFDLSCLFYYRNKGKTIFKKNIPSLVKQTFLLWDFMYCYVTFSYQRIFCLKGGRHTCMPTDQITFQKSILLVLNGLGHDLT